MNDADIEATREREQQSDTRRRAIEIRLPRGRHASPWSSRGLVLISLVALVLLMPLWLDQTTLNQLRNVTAEPIPTPSVQAAVPVTAAPTVAVPASVVARDSYERAVAVGLGEAEVGGEYTITGEAARLAVTAGTASVQLVPGQPGSALLPETQAQHLDVALLIDASARPPAGEIQLAILLRRLDDGTEYRATVHLSAAEAVSMSIEVTSAGQTRTIAGPIALPETGRGLLRMRAAVDGSDPATIRARAWMASDPEPAFWHMSVADWTGSLQAEGSFGIGWSLDPAPSSAPVTLRIDDVLATSSDGLEL